MQDKDILQGVAETLIGSASYTITVPIKEPIVHNRTFWDRLLRRPIVKIETERTFIINQCVVGNMYRVASRAVTLPHEILSGTQAQSILPIINDHLHTMVYIVAAGIQNTKDEPEAELIEFIQDNFVAEDLYNSLLPVLENLGMQSFLNSIALVRGTVKILEPNASPLDGSELIASHIQE